MLVITEGVRMNYFFFDGFTFKTDTIKWRQIKNAISDNLLLQDTAAAREACLDCADYILAYKLKVGRSSNTNRSSFTLFEQFLKDSLVSPINLLKHPLLHK